MAKIKTVFFCQNCGVQAPKWLGKCPSCGEWNTFVEEVVHKPDQKYTGTSSTKRSSKSTLISEISLKEEYRVKSGNEEFDRVLGGGIIPGSVVLIGGEPGIGKSTLMLQIALQLKGLKTLYVSGEENEQQIKLRAERTGSTLNTHCYILTETNTQDIFRQIEELSPEIVVIDSIQTLTTSIIDSSAGSISQIRECTSELLKFAKETSTPVFLIGHITKDGSIAGPKILEHMVDTVLMFEGDRNHIYRILRSTKNRFGSTSELGIFEMQTAGLREVSNPSEILVSHRNEEYSGITISATLEGLRPILIETQALVSTAAYGMPQRSSTGFDSRRLNMLLAVLEKRCGFRLAAKDVFLNIAGGLRVEDPAIDLGVVCAILSSGEDISVSSKTCFAAEVGLSGEIRAISRIEQRLTEAVKMGYQKMFISKYNLKGLEIKKYDIEIIPITKMEEVFSQLFG